MRRRDFVGYGSAAALAGMMVLHAGPDEASAQASTGYNLELHLEEIYEEMIDGEVLFALVARDPLTRAIRPSLTVVEGANVAIRVTNKTRRARRLTITRYAADHFPAIPAGQSRYLHFVAPEAGTYLYHDNSEAMIGRAAGLFGALVVLPADGRTANGAYTPYTKPTLAQQMLFDVLGTGRFPGDKWRPEVPERNKLWVFGSVDPSLQMDLERERPVDPGTFRHSFRPRYFTINGLSGYDSAHSDAIAPSGYIGEPTVIRSINAGVETHAPHIHGNHVFVLASSGATGGIGKSNSIVEVDTWMLRSMSRVDVLLPFIKPDDIPARAWPPKEEQFPLRYPMHCHIEMSQTAAGGNYPQGLVTDWEILGLRRGGAA